jgi:hypothetical protein
VDLPSAEPIINYQEAAYQLRDIFMQLYDQVKAVPKLERLNLSGEQLLKQNPAAMAFYRELEADHINRGKLTH